ncbi:DUF92 family protein [Natrialba magadii ATCC 43099]|uniref:DUF92 family protein n=1 Tax=Natrialba magadii (strain ATCC 43099 / DSM 3394 / CCM 3739 / CIP 104546 / IAM 13178 / JCM 8861 / NBRC 102185 / NCIMB 2190 / MS3) TaxID=547559 RepID=D3SS83_NATMM|nr:DUF92 domain-containing protein [Natrialba magadii]ADD04809.1 DUF92 family protein [Natrialba magadii ATCC 43099]ELY24476.1 hypothetical protein C500_18650 [Natrialba magadii ATCC 43099]
MTSPVRRASVFAALSTLSLAVPLAGLEVATALAAAVLLGAFLVTDGPLFELVAYPGDYEDRRLYGLITFVLAAVALGLVAVNSSMTLAVFVGTVLLVGYGNLAERLVRARSDSDVLAVTAFCLVATVAAALGQLVTLAAAAGEAATVLESALPSVLFLAASGALLAALLRDVFLIYDDPVVMLSVGFLLWLLTELDPGLGTVDIIVALAITALLGYVSYALETASIAGMITGVLLGLLTIVLGGYAWFAVLIAFFGVGGLSTKFRYGRKEELGVAEDNNGARGSGNVLGNAAVAIAAVLGYAASSADLLPVTVDLFLFAFAGSVATAMSDTLSSEVGSVFETPRLITTLEPVEPGTDGGITWQGEVAGLTGAAIVGGLSYLLFPAVGAVGAAIIVAAGFVGMTVDSLLGATLEGTLLGNQGVNFLATLSGAIVCAVLLMLFSTAVLG